MELKNFTRIWLRFIQILKFLVILKFQKNDHVIYGQSLDSKWYLSHIKLQHEKNFEPELIIGF